MLRHEIVNIIEDYCLLLIEKSRNQGRDYCDLFVNKISSLLENYKNHFGEDNFYNAMYEQITWFNDNYDDMSVEDCVKFLLRYFDWLWALVTLLEDKNGV